MIFALAAWAAHPVGPVDADVVRRAGLRRDVTEVSCLSCHDAHGNVGEDMLPADAYVADCVACHTRIAQRPRDGHPWNIRTAAHGLPLGPQNSLACISCHSAHGEDRATASCRACHGAEQQELREGGHAEVACLDCHDVHPGVGGAHAGQDGDPDGCLACHAPGRRAAQAGIAPGSLGHPVGGAARQDGEALSCRSCHGDHAPTRPPGCGECHEDQAAAEKRGGHGDTDCVDCHPAHATAPMATLRLDLNPATTACLACHGDQHGQGKATRVPELEHPDLAEGGKRWTPLAGLPLYDASGAVLPTGQNGAITCGSCHVTHGPYNDKDKLRRTGWEKACASCHGDDALPLYRYWHQPERRAGIGLKPR